MSGKPGRSGGKRRHHVLPALCPADVDLARRMYSVSPTYKPLMRYFNVSRSTLYAALTGKGTYATSQPCGLSPTIFPLHTRSSRLRKA